MTTSLRVTVTAWQDGPPMGNDEQRSAELKLQSGETVVAFFRRVENVGAAFMVSLTGR